MVSAGGFLGVSQAVSDENLHVCKEFQGNGKDSTCQLVCRSEMTMILIKKLRLMTTDHLSCLMIQM